MAHLTQWKAVYRAAYLQNPNDNDIGQQDNALQVLTERANWIFNRLRDLGIPNNFYYRLYVEMHRAELNDLVTCFQRIRQFHIRRTARLNRNIQWMMFAVRLRSPLPNVCALELEHHRQAFELYESLQNELPLINDGDALPPDW